VWSAAIGVGGPGSTIAAPPTPRETSSTSTGGIFSLSLNFPPLDRNRLQAEAAVLVVPGEWVAGQLGRLRSLSYSELRALPALSRTFTFEADDGRFRGEVRVSFDDPDRRAGDVRIAATIWAADTPQALATADFTRTPDE
jgi:hypothetical protein